MGAARLALVPRELDVALRCVELHVVGERQDGVRRGVGGERLPWLVVHPVDAGSALLLPAWATFQRSASSPRGAIARVLS